MTIPDPGRGEADAQAAVRTGAQGTPPPLPIDIRPVAPRSKTRAKRAQPQAKPLPSATAKSLRQARPKKAAPAATAAAVANLKAEPVNPLEHEELTEAAVRNAPAWLVSLVVHTALLITLGLLYVARQVPNMISLDVIYAEDIGIQLEDDRLQAASFDTTNVDEAAYSLDELPVDDPLAAPPDIKPELHGFTATDRVKAPPSVWPSPAANRA